VASSDEDAARPPQSPVGAYWGPGDHRAGWPAPLARSWGRYRGNNGPFCIPGWLTLTLSHRAGSGRTYPEWNGRGCRCGSWAGSTERGERHYFRVQGPGLLIEHDVALGSGNHIHSVWRVPGGDFGDDLLAAHYRAVRH